MKIAYRLFLVLLISAFLFGCGEKKSGVEGKLLDGKGQPVSDITVVFKQVEPSKGYEQFETKTLPDGSFRIEGLMSASEYIILPVSDNWKTAVSSKFTTLTEGQTLTLSTPIIIRFNVLKDGTVIDTKTGLQWLILGITDLNSSNVLNAVLNIKEGGFTDWRLPTKTEILSIQETPVSEPTATEAGLFQKTCCVWVTDPVSGNVEWKFYLDDGNDVWTSSKTAPDDRIVVVRNYTGTPSASQAPAAGTPAPAASPDIENKPTAEPIAPAAVKKEISSVKREPGALRASRKACLANKAQGGKTTFAAAAPEVETPLKTSAAVEKADIPSTIKKEPGARRASRKACLANITQGGKTRFAEVTPEVAVAPVSSKPAKPTVRKVKAKTVQRAPAIRNYTVSIKFAMNQSNISPEELVKLKTFYAKIKGASGRILIEGHADSDGNASDDFNISSDRALSVKAMLNNLGLEKAIKIQLSALGDSKPIADTTSEQGHKLNRRADVTFIPE